MAEPSMDVTDPLQLSLAQLEHYSDVVARKVAGLPETSCGSACCPREGRRSSW